MAKSSFRDMASVALVQSTVQTGSISLTRTCFALRNCSRNHCRHNRTSRRSIPSSSFASRAALYSSAPEVTCEPFDARAIWLVHHRTMPVDCVNSNHHISLTWLNYPSETSSTTPYYPRTLNGDESSRAAASSRGPFQDLLNSNRHKSTAGPSRH